MPYIFAVTNPHGEQWFIGSDGRELTRDEALKQPFQGDEQAAEMARRKRLWSVKHDCREDEDFNPHAIEEI